MTKEVLRNGQATESSIFLRIKTQTIPRRTRQEYPKGIYGLNLKKKVSGEASFRSNDPYFVLICPITKKVIGISRSKQLLRGFFLLIFYLYILKTLACITYQISSINNSLSFLTTFAIIYLFSNIAVIHKKGHFFKSSLFQYLHFLKFLEVTLPK